MKIRQLLLIVLFQVIDNFFSFCFLAQCIDDPNNDLPTECSTIVEFLDCSFDVQNPEQNLEEGTTLDVLCPLSCNNCPGIFIICFFCRVFHLFAKRSFFTIVKNAK